LQTPCQIFVDQPAQLQQPISRSVNSDLQIHFIDLTSQTVLLTFIFISLRNVLIPLTYGHSGFAIELFRRDDGYPL
jgi:hypothetical protein